MDTPVALATPVSLQPRELFWYSFLGIVILILLIMTVYFGTYYGIYKDEIQTIEQTKSLAKKNVPKEDVPDTSNNTPHNYLDELTDLSQKAALFQEEATPVAKMDDLISA